ncbi:MAG TPA: transporter substrate-binding domain-containing protein [Opitutaceae bacterium]|nr:transporter substrate-binding domain-containing protein [Opitutaceae bacterium]
MAMTSGCCLITLMILALGVSGCASAPLAPTPEVRKVLAPTGTLRLGLSLGTPGQMVRDPSTGEVRGIGYELGREFAKRLGVPFEVVVIQGNAQFLEAMQSGRVDFGSINATPARAMHMDFAQAHLAVEAGLLVPSTSKIASITDVDRPGVRVGVTQGSTTEAKFVQELKAATLVRAPSIAAAQAMLASGQLDVYATNKGNLFDMADKLPGWRVLDGRYGVEQVSIAIPKGRVLGMPFLRQFVEDAKSSGLVAAAAQRAGLRGIATEAK